MTAHVRSGGVYKNVDFHGAYERASGVYSVLDEIWVRNSGAYKLAWRADGPPPAPTSLSSSAVNGGYINVGWAYAANVENDYNRVEVQQPGDIARIGTNYAGTTQQRSGYAHGAGVSLQARTVDNGGQVSAWATVPGVTALNALPGAAAIQNMWFDGTNFQLQWYDPGNPYGDISAVQVFYRNATVEGGWTFHSQWSTAGGLRQVTLAGRGWDGHHQAFVRVINNAGYTDSALAGVWAPPMPGTEKTIAAYVGDSWGYNAGAYRNDGTVRAGQFSATPWGPHYGMFFYGDWNLWNLGHGYQANYGYIFMIRNGSEGFSGNMFFEPHGYGTPPGANPSGLNMLWSSEGEFQGFDASRWEPIPTGVLGAIANGSAQGMGIWTPSLLQSNYKVFKGPALNGLAGVVRLGF